MTDEVGNAYVFGVCMYLRASHQYNDSLVHLLSIRFGGTEAASVVAYLYS